MIHSFAFKKNLLIFFTLPALFFIAACSGDTVDIPEFSESDTGPYMLDMTHLNLLKSKLDDPFIQEEYNRLILVADDLLINNFEYVTDKDNIPPSGDINDYMSLARYLWPDPSTGVYTETRDGITNPEIYQYDRPKLDRISNAIFYLSLAYFYSENEEYAEKATNLISKWFIEKDTRMNPNLNYAQVALGVNNNSGNLQGIIDTIDFIDIIDSISLIYDSRFWTSSKHTELKKWFYSFSEWIDSRYNADAFCKVAWCNNVSTWFDAQKIIYFLFTEQVERLNSTSSVQPIEKKISLQFTSDGIQKNEETRALSQHYFYFNLRAYMKIAQMRKQRTGFDRDWPVLNSADFGGIKPSLDIIVNYLNGEDPSQFFSPTSDFDNCRYLEIFKPAAVLFEHAEYEDVSKQLLYHGCSNLNISLTLPPLKWMVFEEPVNPSLF